MAEILVSDVAPDWLDELTDYLIDLNERAEPLSWAVITDCRIVRSIEGLPLSDVVRDMSWRASEEIWGFVVIDRQGLVASFDFRNLLMRVRRPDGVVQTFILAEKGEPFCAKRHFSAISAAPGEQRLLHTWKRVFGVRDVAEVTYDEDSGHVLEVRLKDPGGEIYAQ